MNCFFVFFFLESSAKANLSEINCIEFMNIKLLVENKIKNKIICVDVKIIKRKLIKTSYLNRMGYEIFTFLINI